MSHRRRLLAAFLGMSTLMALPPLVWADAAGDLNEGRAALLAGDQDKALRLLISAAQGLPQSVEAQLALGQAQLQAGDFDKALDQYKKVLALSPDHASAKRMVEALTGQKTRFDRQLASARTLIELASYDAARDLLSRLAAQPLEPAQRATVRLALAESNLWANRTREALDAAMKVLEETAEPALVQPARVIAGLSVALAPEASAEKVAALVKAEADLAAPWGPRRTLALALADMQDPKQAQSLLNALTGAAMPAGALRQAILSRVVESVVAVAKENIARGQAPGVDFTALVGNAPLPDGVPPEVLRTSDWLDDSAAGRRCRALVAEVFIAQGKASPATDPARFDALAEAWRILRTGPAGTVDVERLLGLAQELAGLHRVAPDRKPGTLLSPAVALQKRMLTDLGPLATLDSQRQRIVDLVGGQLALYRQADDLETGLKHFLGDDLASPAIILPPGAGRRALFIVLGQQLADQGGREFAKAAQTLATTANAAMNRYDQAGLVLLGQAAALEPGDAAPTGLAMSLVDRYAQADKWDAAAAGLTAFYAKQEGDAGIRAAIALKVRRSVVAEDKLLAAGQKLPADLPTLVKEAAGQAVSIVQANPTRANRNAATNVLGPLVARYAGLQRMDLAEAVLAAAEAGPKPELADWAVWTRAGLLEQRGNAALARMAAETEGKKLALVKEHDDQVKLLSKLITDHPSSEYLPAAAARVGRVANLYQNRQAFDVAGAVLDGFLKVHGKIEPAQALEWQAVGVKLAKARAAFDERPDKTLPPAAISAEYDAALTALADYMKARPTGPYSAQAPAQMVLVARVYGEAGAWPVARAVVERLAAAMPEARSPGRVKLLLAATHLGELDRAYGLGLLTPPPLSLRPGEEISRPDATDPFGPPEAMQEPRSHAEGLTRAPGSVPPAGAPADQAGQMAQGQGGGGEPKPMVTTPARPGSREGDFAGEDFSRMDRQMAAIRQSESATLQRIALLQDNKRKFDGKDDEGQAIALPSGPVLSEAEMARQDAAADKAYAILLELARSVDPAEAAVARAAADHLSWLFGFFEGQVRHDRAIALIQQYLKDRPSDPHRIALAFRAITDRLALAAQTRKAQRIDQAWVDARHDLYELARAELGRFIADHPDKRDWLHQARLTLVESYRQEAGVAAAFSPVRAGGLLAQAADALLELARTVPDHPQAANFPQMMWNIADGLVAHGQTELAVAVLSQIPIHHPTHPLANQAVLRIAGLYGQDLNSPIRAVEAYQEYLSRSGDAGTVQQQVYSIGEQLAGRKRYVEALHVFGVFVDSFPGDARASEALRQIGSIHQINEAWALAIAAYQRVLDEYQQNAAVPPVKLAIAECHINLGQWRQARKIYEDYTRDYPNDGNVALARGRMEILKSLERYDTLLADASVKRNRDDAQFQIGKIVLERLGNRVKALEEFRKVVSAHEGSALADDAQLEIGRTLLAMGRMDEAREELLKVPKLYPGSPWADDALYLVGQSFEQQAAQLAAVTHEKAREIAYEGGQRAAYQQWNEINRDDNELNKSVRQSLKSQGKLEALAFKDAYDAARYNGMNQGTVGNLARQAEQQTETEQALQVANRQDRINEAHRQAVTFYGRAVAEHPLGDMTDESLLRMASIYETQLKDRKAAMETYQRVVKFFPGTPQAEDAAWKVAKFHEAEAQYTDAVNAYRDFIRAYPGSGRVADAQFAMAEALEHLGRWVEAMDAYQTFRDKFPQHGRAQAALEQIQWIKAYK